MITENLSTLKIHKLSQEQYDRELEAGRIDKNALYLTHEDTGTDEIYVKLKESTTAYVGQLLIVKAVDENGKPTEWETKNPIDIFAEFGFTVDENGILICGFKNDTGA